MMYLFLLGRMDMESGVMEEVSVSEGSLAPRTGLNQRIFRLNFSIKSGIFTDFSKFFAKFLEFSTNLDIFEHLPEIPTKFHLHFDEK